MCFCVQFNCWFIIYCLIISDNSAHLADEYTTTGSYTGQVYQPVAPPEQTEYIDSYEEEPPLLEGNKNYLFDQQKAAWLESDFCVSCASYITALMIIEKRKIFMQNFADISVMWLHLKGIVPPKMNILSSFTHPQEFW